MNIKSRLQKLFDKNTGHRKKILKWSYIAMVTAIAVLAIITAIPAINTLVVATSGTKRMLPIYSVQRDDMKISISFDAAWANSIMRTNY